jgi:hypothetical protein
MKLEGDRMEKTTYLSQIVTDDDLSKLKPG